MTGILNTDPYSENKGRRTLQQIFDSSVGIEAFEKNAKNENYEMKEILDFYERKYIDDGNKAGK